MRVCGPLAALLLVGLAVPVQAQPKPTPPPAAQETALAQAKRTGKPVELAEHTTETSKVEVQADGSMKLTSSARPVRVKRDGRWRDTDLTLKARPDGSLAPVASPADVVFGGGGTAPAITFADGDRAISLSWPGELPKPKADKDSAVYPEVLPGVDLRVTAGLSGFTEVLVVKTAEAARNPALASLKLIARTTGMTLRTAADGTLSTLDSSGKPVFHGSTPVMWDSRTEPGGGTPTAAAPAGKVTKLSVTQAAAKTAATTDVTIVPAPEALKGKDVIYPVYLDPGLSRFKEAWLGLTDKNWRQWNTSYPAQVGFCDWGARCGETFRSRSFFRFDTSAIQSRNGHRAVLTGASVYALQTHSIWNDCTAEPTDLYWGGWFDGNTSWPGPEGGWSGTGWSGRGDNCRDGAGTVRFDAGNAVQKAINDNWNLLNVYLRAPDEGNRNQWKKFDPNPTLEATFNFPPNTPGGLGVVEAVSCYSKLTSPTARPTLVATATDNNNPPLDLSIAFEVWTPDEKTLVRTGSATIPSNGRASWAPGEALPEGDLKFRTRARNLTGDAAPGIESGWSGWRSFSVRAAPVTGYPWVVDDFRMDYPRDNWGQQSGSPGTVTLSHSWDSPSDKNVVGFSYTFNGPGTETVPATTDCDYDRTFGTAGGWVSTRDGNATIQVPPGLSPGRHTIYARSFDDAHKMGPEERPTEIYVAPSTGGGVTRVEGESLQVTQPAGQNVSTEQQDSSCCDFKWSGNKQMAVWFTAAGQKADFVFTVPNTGDPTGAEYQLGAGATKSWDYGQVQYYLDGEAVGYDFNGTPSPINYYGQTTMRRHDVLAHRRLTPGTHRLTVEVKGTWSPWGRFGFGLDYLTLSTTSRYEAEKLPVSQPPGQNAAVGLRTDYACCFNDQISGGLAQQLTGGSIGQSFDLAFRVPIEADYALAAVMIKEPGQARVEIQVDGKTVARTGDEPHDGYVEEGKNRDYFTLGGQHLAAGEHKITFKITGRHPDAKSTNVVVDYLTAVPVNNVTAASFEAAMNNDGIGASAANLDFGQAGLSAASLAAAGLAPGQQKTINGATFTMPPHKADGSDNVVALGQRIPLPQTGKASAIGLLVTSTCGVTKTASATITYTDGTTQNQVVPEIEDWAGGQEEAAEFVLPSRVGGGTQIKPRLQVVFVHANPSKTAQSVTLPNYGTSLMPGCPQAALHVLAMAPRPVDAGWVGTWAAPSDKLVTPPGGTGLKDRTVRTVIDPSVAGASVRIKLQNPGTSEPMTVGAASVGAQSGTDTATVAAPVALKFAGAASVVVPAGGEVLSDAVAFPAGGTGKLVVSTFFTTAVTKAPVHGFTPSFLNTGDKTAVQAHGGTQIDGVYYLAGVQVSTTTTGAGTVVVLGDQFSAHADSWVDRLPEALRQEGDAVPGGLVNASRAGVAGSGQVLGISAPPAGSGAPTIGTAGWTLDRAAVSQPNVRTVVMALGTNDVLAGRSRDDIVRDVRAMVHPASPGSLRNVRRADGSLVHVILATLPPLGLGADDTREQARQDVNSALRNEYVNLGADGVLDMAGMVAEPGEDNVIAPDLLTGGAPNARFHEKVARDVAIAVTGFPPLEL